MGDFNQAKCNIFRVGECHDTRANGGDINTWDKLLTIDLIGFQSDGDVTTFWVTYVQNHGQFIWTYIVVVVVRKKKIDKIFFSTETDSIPRNW